MYELTYNLGEITWGNFDDCICVLFHWLESTEAKQLYNNQDRKNIHSFFDKSEKELFKDEDCDDCDEIKEVEYNGFNLKEI